MTVTKECPNGKAADGDRFQVKLGATNVGAPLDCGDSVEAHPSAGAAYSITEAAAGTTDLANYDAPQYSAGCSGTLAHFGDSAGCTITNTLKAAPVVTVHKVCTTPKAAQTDLFQVELNGDASGDPLDCGDSVDLHPGAGKTYTIAEGAAGTTDLANYDAPQYTADCTGTLAHFGDSASCTITNALRNAPEEIEWLAVDAAEQSPNSPDLRTLKRAATDGFAPLENMCSSILIVGRLPRQPIFSRSRQSARILRS